MNNIEDATLSDVGQKVEVLFQGIYRHTNTERIISMIIKAPKGRLILLDNGESTAQVEAIKLFMQEHSYD